MPLPLHCIALEAILHFAEQIISSGRGGPGHLTDGNGQGLRPTKRYVMHALKPFSYMKRMFSYTDVPFSSKESTIFIMTSFKIKSLRLMKWLHIASKWRIDCVMVQQSMTNCRSNLFNWQGHLSLSYKRKQLLSTKEQQIIPFRVADLCF